MPMPAQQPQQQPTAQPQQPDVLDQAITSVLPAHPAQSVPAQTQPDPSKNGGVLGAAALGALKATQPSQPKPPVKQPDVLDTAITSVLNPTQSVGAADSAAEQPSGFSRFAHSAVENTPLALVMPPQDAQEQIVHTVGNSTPIGGDNSLAVYRTARGIVDSVENAYKSTRDNYHHAVQDVKNAMVDFHQGQYGKAISDVSSGLGHTAATVHVGASPEEVQQAAQTGLELRQGNPEAYGKVTGQAATLLGSVLAPEVWETAPETEAAETAETAETATPKGLMNKATGQTALQGATQKVAAKTAEGAAVTPSPAAPSRLFEGLGDSVNAKAKELYQQVDEASGVDLKRLREKIGNARQEIRGLSDAPEDVEREAKLEASIKNNEEALQRAQQTAIENGVDPNTLKAADAAWKQSQALYDLDKNLKLSTSGRAEVTGTSESVDAKKLAPRLEKLWDSGRLQQALGDENSKQLMNDVYAAAKREKFINVTKWLASRALLYGIFGEALRHGIE